MFMFYQVLFLVLCASTSALTPAQWRSQSIYQVITDRFARTDGSTSASCDLNRYCGGTWQGLIKKLDYIQNMGFSAVSLLDMETTLQLTRPGLDLACCTELGAEYWRRRGIPRVLGDEYLRSQHELWICCGPGETVVSSA